MTPQNYKRDHVNGNLSTHCDPLVLVDSLKEIYMSGLLLDIKKTSPKKK